MSRFAQFDAALIEAIKAGRNTFDQLNRRDLIQMAAPLAVRDRWGTPIEWRVIDQRLQALRKSGQIHYHKGAWHIGRRDTGADHAK